MNTKIDFENNPLIIEAITRNLIEIHQDRISYNIHQKKTYSWNNPEEWVRAYSIAFLVLNKSYTPQCIRTEVAVPRRTPEDFADIVVYREEKCQTPYLVVENKKNNINTREKNQAIEQLFGNANSLRASVALFDNYIDSTFYDVENYPSTERAENIKGDREVIPKLYGNIPVYSYIAGPGNNDIKPASAKILESKVKKSHSIIWSGGKRDPLLAFDEWSKLMLAKVEDERHTPNGAPRQFQVGTNETYVAVASRIHSLFKRACRTDQTIFPENISINLSDKKIVEVVRTLQNICITDTSVDNIGKAFEIFFGSVFRGELGQYFTMRPLARFTVAMLDITPDQYVIDLTCGSGGFLLEVLLQVWNRIDRDYAGRRELDRIKNDFALQQVYGIEIHEILARICKINLLLHHDGHTNIEGDRSCLDTEFTKPRLQQYRENFNVVVGNLPFGDSIVEGDDDQLGKNSLENFEVASGKSQIPSEHVMLEKAVDMLEEEGTLGIILPDGMFNNSGDLSNCPQVRKYLIKNGLILSVVSLPDYAFRKSGAQNKTSILFFKKFTYEQKAQFENAYNIAIENDNHEDKAITEALSSIRYKTFMAEANYIGYTATGALSTQNDLYIGSEGGFLFNDQKNTILGEYRKFSTDPNNYIPDNEDCICIDIYDAWTAHPSHRLDPKYHLFKSQEKHIKPEGWISKKIKDIMTRRNEIIHPEENPDKAVKVMTLAQTGDIRQREAGKGKNPPEWLGMYFEDSSSTWFKAYTGDVVFSSIDLWKGCISVVPKEFNGALVTKEFPIYKMLSNEIEPEFLATLLRSRYYQKAFRAITTGHSNRRRTQTTDFESIEICFPEDKKVQKELIHNVVKAKKSQKDSIIFLKNSIMTFSDIIDGRGDEEFEIVSEDDK